MSAAIHFFDNTNLKAMAGSIAFHSLVGIWMFSGVVPVEIMPQQMIKVTMIAAPATENSKQQPKPVPKVESQSKKVVESVKPTAIRKESPHALYRPEIRQSLPPEPKEHKSNTPEASAASAANAAAIQAPAQLVTSEPLFDAAYLNNPAPEYPQQAKRRGMEGSVMIGVIVTAEGRAKSVTVEESSGFAALDSSAKEAVSRWRFIPAKRGNETVEARVMVPIDFRLE